MKFKDFSYNDFNFVVLIKKDIVCRNIKLLTIINSIIFQVH